MKFEAVVFTGSECDHGAYYPSQNGCPLVKLRARSGTSGGTEAKSQEQNTGKM